MARCIERMRTLVDDPLILATRRETARLSARMPEIRKQAEAYCEKVGLKDCLTEGDASEIDRVYTDLSYIHQLVRDLKPSNIVELGVGFSTLTMAHALMMNGSGTVHSVDANKHWIENTRKKIPEELRPFVRIRHSRVRTHLINGQLCTLFDELPNVQPEFIYVDAPHGKDVEDKVHGLDFMLDDGDMVRPPVAADPLLYESTAPSTFFILVDGRDRNVEFLRRNLQGRYRYQRSGVFKRSYFEKM